MVAGVAVVPLVGGLTSLMVLWAAVGFGFSLWTDADWTDYQPLGS